VVGHSHLKGKVESRWATRLARHRAERLEPAVARYGGCLVKLGGDSTRAEFPSAGEALGAAIEFQQAMSDANRGQSGDTAVVFRLGLHFGDASELGGEGAVRRPEERAWKQAREQARGGGIVVSAPLRDAVAGRLRVSFAGLGSAGLGTIEQPVHAYEVGWDPADWPAVSSAAAMPITARGDGKRPSLWAIAIAGAALLTCVFYLASTPQLQPGSAGWRVPGAGSLERQRLERRAEAALAHWWQEQDEPDDQPANPDNAEPADAYDGLYTGTATSADGRVVTFKVKVANGIGSGTQSRLDCGTAPLSLRISPWGKVSGMVLIFGSTCLKTELALRGSAIAGMLRLRLGSQYLELSKPDD
jgi:hypothetical protein